MLPGSNVEELASGLALAVDRSVVHIVVHISQRAHLQRVGYVCITVR